MFSFLTGNFVASQALLSFDCRFYTSSWSIIGTQYACSARVTISNGGNELTGVTGSHQTGRTNSDVKMLVVHDQTHVNQFPGGINNFFPNLIGLEFFNSQIASISAENLRPFPSLQMLNIQKNSLSQLDGNLFAFTPSLKWIGFSDNVIEHIGLNLLSNLNSLSTAFFLGNVCIDSSATTPTALAELVRVLPFLCPPFIISPSTTNPPPGDCSIECFERIDALRIEFSAETREIREQSDSQGQRIQELSEENETQTTQINQLITDNSELRQILALYEARILELEKQVREITSNP